jgi:hypothetical protein
MKNFIKLAIITIMLGSIAFVSQANDNKKSANLLKKWRIYDKKLPQGTIIQPDKVIVCKTQTVKDSTGVSQTITLNQTAIKPILFSAESKAENVSGTQNNDYAIYLDITHTDDTKTYGITAKFKTGTHDWETASRLYTPRKPIKRLSYYLLFRKHTGKAWFKNIVLKEVNK